MPIKCANIHCLCQVVGAKTYCSQHCERNAKEPLLSCGCGHAICQQIYGARPLPPAEASPARKRGWFSRGR